MEKKSVQPKANKETRKQRILEAATLVFLEKGYERTNLDLIIEQVGGSKQTLYSYFGNKQNLFAAVVQHAAQQTREGLTFEAGGIDNPEATLATFGKNYLRAVLSDRAIALHRLVVSQSVKHPEAASIFLEQGPESVSQNLAAFLDELQCNGQVKIANTQQASDLFLGMLRGHLHLETLMDTEAALSSEKIDQVVNQAVRIFIWGITEE